MDWHKLVMPLLYKSSVNCAGGEGSSRVTLSLWRTLCTCYFRHYPRLQNLTPFLEIKCVHARENPVCLMCFLKGENLQRPAQLWYLSLLLFEKTWQSSKWISLLNLTFVFNRTQGGCGRCLVCPSVPEEWQASRQFKLNMLLWCVLED